LATERPAILGLLSLPFPPVSSEDWLRRVAGIKQWSQGGVRAPHKPLLLLYAIGRLYRFGTSEVTFREAEEPLRRLILTYGPPGAGGTPQYPFRRLENDGLWRVTITGGADPGERVQGLRQTASGRLSPDFELALTDPVLRSAVVQLLLDRHFPPSLHDDLLADVGLEPGDLTLAWDQPAAGKPKRDPLFRGRVLVAYEYRCAFCGYDGRLATDPVGLDAAHIRWHGFDGPDTVDNGMGLCTLHHKLFDQGAMGLDPDHRVLVSRHFVGRGPTAEGLVLGLVGRPLQGPQPGEAPPAPEHVAWHRKQVFREPARVA